MKLGVANVDRMLRSLTAKQFAEWRAYAAIDPFEETRQDYRIASIVQMLANVNRDPKRRQTPYELEEMRLKFGERNVQERRQTRETHIALIKAYVQAFSAKAEDT